MSDRSGACSFGEVTREMVTEQEKSINEIKIRLNDLTDRYVNRLPVWATLLLSLLSSIVTGLIVWGIRL